MHELENEPHLILEGEDQSEGSEEALDEIISWQTKRHSLNSHASS